MGRIASRRAQRSAIWVALCKCALAQRSVMGAMGTHEDPMGTNGRAMGTQGDPMGTMGGDKSFFTTRIST